MTFIAYFECKTLIMFTPWRYVWLSINVKTVNCKADFWSVRRLGSSWNFKVFRWINLNESFRHYYTAISRKVVGKSARDNPKRYCGWFRVHCFSKKFQRMAREAMDVCFRVLKESNKSRFYSYSVRKSALIISHITFRDCRVHSFSDNLSRNSCIHYED